MAGDRACMGPEKTKPAGQGPAGSEPATQNCQRRLWLLAGDPALAPDHT